jgi:D-arabinose 1-dehydrogenase-like Zn-dependent alcohol dehydrogenase
VTDAKSMSAVIGGLGIDGKLLIVGASGEPVEVAPLMLIGARRSIAGWPSGTASDSEDTLKFSMLTNVCPMVETFPLENAREACQHMLSGKARFRVVLTP